MVTFPSAQVQRATGVATVAQQAQVRGRSPMTTVSANPAAVAVSSAATAAPPQLPPSSSVPPPPPLPLPPPRHQPAMTFANATSPAHPVKVRGQATAQGLQLGQAQPQAPPPTIQQSVLPQRLVLTSQAQARLPSKCPSALLPSGFSSFLLSSSSSSSSPPPPLFQSFPEVKLLGTLTMCARIPG
ncbi:E1A-binding protein p400-like [Notechis scutatus]|uniref:E1A-binding protein p400-like n=1 Tax=Notechis scutatus TaxID=8663 RepID=A0A6J1WBS0_9SAUR|nr:E1A-binding protein p400-like [Notechis scutatus]